MCGPEVARRETHGAKAVTSTSAVSVNLVGCSNCFVIFVHLFYCSRNSFFTHSLTYRSMRRLEREAAQFTQRARRVSSYSYTEPPLVAPENGKTTTTSTTPCKTREPTVLARPHALTFHVHNPITLIVQYIVSRRIVHTRLVLCVCEGVEDSPARRPSRTLQSHTHLQQGRTRWERQSAALTRPWSQQGRA